MKDNKSGCPGRIVSSIPEGLAYVAEVGLPVLIKPAFAVGDNPRGVAITIEEFTNRLDRAIECSMTNEVCIERVPSEIEAYLAEAARIAVTIYEHEDQIARIVEEFKTCVHKEGTVYGAGNGGSASQISHFLGELYGINFQCPIMSLPDLVPGLTAVANDDHYDNVYSNYLSRVLKTKDLLVAFTTSGKSKNVVNALSVAKEHKATSILITGKHAPDLPATINIRINSDMTEHIQEATLIILHVVYRALKGG